MSDVSINYNGMEIASLDDSGTKTLLTSGKYCDDNIDVVYTKPSGGGSRSVSGSFTLVSNSYLPVIQHNLGTEKICGIIWPAERLSPSSGYLAWYLEFINVPAVFDEVPLLELDFTSYNTHFSDVTEVPMDDPNFWIGITHNSPWQTQSTWRSTANGANAKSESSFSITSTTVTMNSGQKLAQGKYNFIIWALGD